MFKRFLRLIFFTALLLFFTFIIDPNQITSLIPTSKADQVEDKDTATQPEIIQEKYIPTDLGDLIYYNQNDERWSGYLYGGSDPMYKYGCGPTVISMIVSSFTDSNLNPAQMSDWAYENSYWASASGSFHSLISGSLSEFGLKTESIRNRSAESIVSKLESGHIIVALMDDGHFTQSGGHFIILTGINAEGKISVADPNNLLNTDTGWDPNLISKELRKKVGYGGPLWAVSR